MNKEEALREINDELKYIEEVMELPLCPKNNIAIYAKKKDMYVAIKDALEKQIPQQPVTFKDFDQDDNELYYCALCPTCAHMLPADYILNEIEVCNKCHQILDWTNWIKNCKEL